jgi:hypothetical protein
MKSEEILHQTVRLLARRARWVRQRALLLQALFIGLCLCVAVAVLYRFISLPIGRLVEINLACMVLCALAAVIIGLRARTEPMALLIKADRSLRLKERLSTAYELANSPQPHPFCAIVLQEAARTARSVNPFRVIPATTPKTLRWTPFLLLAAILVLVVDFGVMLPASFVGGVQESSQPALYQQGQKLERLGKRLESEARQHGLERSLETARRMQNVGLRLQNEKLNERDALVRVNSLTEYVRNLEEELKKMAVLEDVNVSKVREVMVNQANLSGEVQRLLGMLAHGKLSPGEMRNLQERLQNLGQQGSGNERLNDALGQLREGDLEGAKETLESYLRQDQLAQDFDHLQRTERTLERGLERGPDGGEEMDLDHPSGENREYGEYEMGAEPSGDSAGLPGDFEGGDSLGSEAAGAHSSTGSGRGTETETHQTRIAEANAPASKITGQSGEGGVRRSYVRALPLKAEASMPLEEVIATYQRRAEDSLLREEVPPQNRDIVKAYFLAIGLVEESTGGEGKE